MRSAEGAYLVDGPVLLAEALDSGASVRGVYVEVDPARPTVRDAVDAAAAAGVRVRDVVPGALAKVLDLGTPQSVVAVVDQEPAECADLVAAAAAAGRPLLALVEVADPGNVGTLVRTAEAAGCVGVVLVGNCADPFNPKTVRATAGALFRVPVAPVADLTLLRDLAVRHGVRLVGTVGDVGIPPEAASLAGAAAIVVGGEAHGLSVESVAACDELVTIPMQGRVESLNAAVAGSVVAFESARQRRSVAEGSATVDRSGDATTSVGHNDDPVTTGDPSPERPAPEHGRSPR